MSKRPPLILAVDNTVEKRPAVLTSDVRQLKYEIPLPSAYWDTSRFEFRGFGAMRGFYVTCHRHVNVKNEPVLSVTVSMPVGYGGSTELDYKFIKTSRHHPCVELQFKE